MPETSRRILLDRITANLVVDAHARAWKLAFPRESQYEMIGPDSLRGLVSYEAGTAILRILEKLPEPLPDSHAILKADITAGLKKLAMAPRGAITPIVFSRSMEMTLSEITDSSHLVRFDFDGNGVDEWLPWLSPAGGFLVWDQESPGRVKNGTQLFGSFTFGIHWRDGYAALASLDDNQDGWLTGSELDGLAFWTDRNTKGISEPGEVLSLAEIGVRGVCVHPDGSESGFLCCRRGILLEDGTFRSSWDWAFPLMLRN